MTSRVASSLNDALALTPNQIISVATAAGRMASGDGPKRLPRRGTPEEFKAMILGLAG